MPGPVSDSFDPEWGTSTKAGEIIDELTRVYERLSLVLEGREPVYIGELVGLDMPTCIEARLPEKDWRILRFAIERARESI